MGNSLKETEPSEMSAFDKWDEMHKPFTDEEWAIYFIRVINDPRFKIWGLTKEDIFDVKFYLDCWNKTPQQLKEEVPR